MLFVALLLVASAAVVFLWKRKTVAAPVSTIYAARVNAAEALVLFPGDPAKQALAEAGLLPANPGS